jgi:hypothetical protein
MTRLQITGKVMERAAGLARRYTLRGVDAVHLATALDLRGSQRVLTGINEPVILSASDYELLEAAKRQASD